MRAFVTGGSGFIGRSLIRQLIEQGHTVRALGRSESSLNAVRLLGAEPVAGDITDKESMRAGMTGCDVVFHVAAWYDIGAHDWLTAERLNVAGTRHVLTLAWELGVPRIVYTSTVGVLGDTRGALVDETYYAEGPFQNIYEHTKWLAHYKVAIPLIEQGAPIIIVMPGGVYGPGDHSIIADLMRLFYQGMPALAGPETTLTFAHVDDIAAGHILAAEKGRPGESYILAGPAVPFDELFDLWGNLLGRRPPAVQLPARWLHPLAPAAAFVERWASLPRLFSSESIRTLGATYMARSDKARAGLGWTPRPLPEGMQETLEWVARTAPPLPFNARQAAGAALGLAATLTVAWLWNSQRPHPTPSESAGESRPPDLPSKPAG